MLHKSTVNIEQLKRALIEYKLDIIEQAEDYLLGSKFISHKDELKKELMEYALLFDIQKILLYKLDRETKTAKVLITFTPAEDNEKVGDEIDCTDYPNFVAVMNGEEISNMPTEGKGIDIVFRLGHNDLLVGIDSIGMARNFHSREVLLLKSLARSLALAYDTGHQLYVSATDRLTGIRNRGALDRHMDSCVDIYNRKLPKMGALVFADIDHFKKFNDTYGHDIGDQVLIHVAHVLQGEFEKHGGFIYRYGGEELVWILCEDIEQANLYPIIDSIRQKIAETPCFYKGQTYPITLSIGYCSTKHETMPRRLIKKADQALYISKEDGRNRTTAWSPPSRA